ncbi:MAG TPA: DUF748 domain-containing protein [Aromatoleum sp.]|uniref:DUF748 domain-containing protein n=1 Tax=Aromatoleum sp. TaxID=2307007 RepID=UPI002B47DCC4|nr:DUF748 domain-containing protein [Aromatoleum sp.]HJV27803.1 DUF748 domain-containing protein [Aromatoleum sp.]
MTAEGKGHRLRIDRTRAYRAAKWLAGGLVTIALLGFFVLPPIVRHFAEKAIAEFTGRSATLEEVSINPFALSLTARGVHLAEADGRPDAFSLSSLYVNMEAESLFRLAPVLREVRIEAPQIHVALLEGGRHSWTDVVEKIAARPKDENESPALFSLNNLQLINGAVLVDDETTGVKHELTTINIGLPFISNLPVKVDLFVEPLISATINGRPLHISGRSRPFSTTHETVLEFKLDSFDLTPYLAYLPFKPSFRVPSARLSTELELSFAEPQTGEPAVALKGTAGLADFQLQDDVGKQLLKLPSLTVTLVDVQPLAGKIHVGEVSMPGAEIDLARLDDGRLNFQRILPTPATESPNAPKPAAPSAAKPEPVFLLDRFALSGATLRIEDAGTGSVPFRTELRDLSVEIKNLANAPNAVTDISAAFVTDTGERLTHEAKLKVAAREIEGKVVAEGFGVGRYLPYYADQIPGGEIRNGQLDANISYAAKAAGDDVSFSAKAESIALRDFEIGLRGQKGALAKIPRLTVSDVVVNPAEHTLGIGTIESTGTVINGVRDKNGQFDALRVLGDKPAAATVPAKAQPKAVAKASAKAAPAPVAPVWSLALNRLALNNWSIRFEDRTQGTPIVMQAEEFKLTADGISTAKGATTRIDLATRVNKRGRIGITGGIGLDPLKGDLRLDLRSVDLLPLQPYVAEAVNIAISRGQITTRGALAFDQKRDGAIKASFKGDIGVDDFASIDKLQATDFVRLRRLAVTGIDLRTEPPALAVGEISLNDFYTRLILDEKGRLNLREIRAQGDGDKTAPPMSPAAAASPPAQATVPPPPEPVMPIAIGKIAIQKGNIAFSDRFIRPNYDANLTGMEGELTGLSSDPSTIAKLDLRGKVDNSAPVTVAGELNPFRQDRYLKIAASVKDFELTGISAYSGKYVGYGIAKGKLSADLNYRIEDRKLTATNRVFLDQLTFGDEVESPDALKVPVRLAVSLLKNSRGEIDLSVPIGGSLDDPEFSVAGIVFKAFINLIGKAITSPFSLLGSMFGGGEELSYIDYAPGRANLEKAATDKIANLAHALSDRPAVKLEITGRADPATDIEGIKRVLLERKIKAAKLKEMLRRGTEAPSLDDVPIDATEYQVFLKQVYRDADFKRPRNAIGLLKDLPAAEMEALLMANTPVDDNALRQLAQLRAQMVKDALLAEGKVSAERIFVLTPHIGGGDDAKEGGAGRRTLFSLK